MRFNIISNDDYNIEYQGYYDKLRDGKNVLQSERKIINNVMFDYVYYYTGELFLVVKYEKNNKNFTIRYFRKSGVEIGSGVYKNNIICDGLELKYDHVEERIALESAKYYKDRKLHGQEIEFFINNESIYKVRTVTYYKNNVEVGISFISMKIHGN